jgi:hypothetical protein
MTKHFGHGDNQTRPGDHTEFLADFRLLADFALTWVESMLATFAESQGHADRTSTSSGESSDFGRSTWCPVCALAAATNGEHHDLLVVLTERLATVLAVLREFSTRFLPDPTAAQDGAVPTPDDPGSRQQRRRAAFVPIDVTVRH